MVMHHPEHGPLLDADDMAALLGVPADQIREHARTAGTAPAGLPREWVERGRSRGDVYRQATGRDDMAGALEFWRAQSSKRDTAER